MLRFYYGLRSFLQRARASLRNTYGKLRVRWLGNSLHTQISAVSNLMVFSWKEPMLSTSLAPLLEKHILSHPEKEWTDSCHSLLKSLRWMSRALYWNECFTEFYHHQLKQLSWSCPKLNTLRHLAAPFVCCRLLYGGYHGISLHFYYIPIHICRVRVRLGNHL